MKKSLLLSSAAILLLGIAQNFEGQEKSQSQLPTGSNTGMARQIKMAQAPTLSRQEPNRWATDQALLDRHRMTKPRAHGDDRTHATMNWKTPAQHELSAGVDTAWVRHYASGLIASDDWAAAIAVDGSGNVYVTGRGESVPFGDDYLTLKYDPSGTQLWMARYNGPGNSSDAANALAVDASGNVYVTGVSEGSGSEGDFATVKYNSDGVEQWVARYNGSGNALDWAYALAMDASGNVYVTGVSASSTSYPLYYDFATVKYNSAGVEQWVARYNGPGNAADEAYALAVDASGNVYVTGGSRGSGTEDDFATVKCNAAGVELWVARYNGPGNGWDRAIALAVDASGNVYVTGGSRVSGTEDDFATVKYNSAGVEQWVNRYNGPGNSWDEASALAMDVSGNVYVTGASRGSGTGNDFATIKYNSAGVQQWVARYNGPANADDYAGALALDATGNVYVTGGSRVSGVEADFATVKYNSDGVQQWVAHYSGADNDWLWETAVAVDASGNVYVTGASRGSGTGNDFATFKYNSAGAEQWVVRYDGQAISVDRVSALAVDFSGDVYVTGASEGSETWSDFATIRYNSAGVQQWITRYHGTKIREGNEYPNALVVDAFGNVYVAGHQGFFALFPSAFLTIKYNSDGVEQWRTQYDGPGGCERDEATALAVDASGNVYVTGSSCGSGTGLDFATIKYNAAGVGQWVARYTGPGNRHDYANALAVDASGSVYVTGTSENSGTRYDFTTVKYNSAGVEQWVVRYKGSANSHDYANVLVLDASSNVYVTGESAGDFATFKYNSAGIEQWVARYNGPANAEDYATAVTVDASGNVYVTGWSGSSGTEADFATVKYNSAGVQQWVTRYSGADNDWDWKATVAVDASGNVYVTGTSVGSGTGDDFATIKYNSAGVQQWAARYNGPGNTDDRIAALALDASGNIYVTGSSEGDGKSVYTTIKYIQTPVSVESGETSRPRVYELSQNYPNPFNPTTAIEFALPKASFVTLKIYDLLGDEVAMLVAEKLPAGKHQRVWEAKGLASGVYLYRLEAAGLSAGSGRGFVQTKKFLLLR